MKKILIIGATSAIASACARVWAQSSAEFFFVARSAGKLAHITDDIQARGGKVVGSAILDLNESAAINQVIEDAFSRLGTIDVALIAHGTLPEQSQCEKNLDDTLEAFNSNAISTLALLTLLANKFEGQMSGSIAVISSVAGDRGRPSNYVYASAKAAVSKFCQGMDARLQKSGVHLLTIKPGFVDTPMTQDLDLPQALTVSPDRVAKDITRAIERKQSTLYTPWFWRYIMLIIIHIPRMIFVKLNL